VNFVIPPSTKSLESLRIQLPLLRDNIVEDDEIFAVMLEVPEDDSVSILRECTIVQIRSQFEGQCK